ncbi:VanZ family protein [Ureibacillus aquaedulcis]|uniref:VanZ family protein n=1 Tax=Ureibacillus aquaedulcis TaxID=3058421 RepID=A0ABT8GR79_9BACL|nr:VanZ family protein [Ureibacillus sp. BA0131]MDN4493926.1 VanZ family protein [Ureibacillus sp. BA0131]
MKKYILLIIAVLILLFCISSMTYQQQTIVPTLKETLESKPFYHLLSRIEVTYWGETISVETRGYYYFIEFLVRKGLHFVGYGFIAILFYIIYRKFKIKLPVIFAILTTFCVASLDEFRQTFVVGRTGIFEDVLLDTAGAITFIFVYKIGGLLYQKIKSPSSLGPNSASDQRM